MCYGIGDPQFSRSDFYLFGGDRRRVAKDKMVGG